MPAEISAATALVDFWNPNINHFIIIRYGAIHSTLFFNTLRVVHSVCWAVIAIINFSPVQVYGEFEFYFAFFKVEVMSSKVLIFFLKDPFKGRSHRFFHHCGPRFGSRRIFR